MTATSIVYALLFYAAVAVFAGGLAHRIHVYARTPAPLKIPTTPAPTTSRGVALRLLREVVLFESLFKSNLWTWACGWLFHAGLALVLVRHLRYFIEPVWGWVAWLQPFGVYAGFAMAAGLAGLWVRRVAVARVRFISTPSDHLMLALLLAIAAVGAGDEVRRAYRHRRGEGLLPRARRCRLAAAAGRRGPLRASRSGRAAAADLPVFQAAARARRLLLADPQPGRRSARGAPSFRLGRAARAAR